MKAIALVQTQDRLLNQIQANIKQAVDPIIANQLTDGNFVTADLATGSNTINHGLNRALQGWSITRKKAVADIYDTQDNNPNPAQTLILVSSAAVSVTVYCF